MSQVQQDGVGSAVSYRGRGMMAVRPKDLTADEKKAFSCAVTYIYAALHEAVQNDLLKKVEGLTSTAQLLSGGFDVILQGLFSRLSEDHVDFTYGALIPEYPLYLFKRVLHEAIHFQYAMVFDYNSVPDIIKNSQKFYGMAQAIYSKMGDVSGLTLIENIRGMWNLERVLCRFENSMTGFQRGRTYTETPAARIGVPEWVHNPMGEPVGDALGEWNYISNILKYLYAIPLEIIYHGIHRMAHSGHFESREENRRMLRIFFCHPIVMDFFGGLFEHYRFGNATRGLPNIAMMHQLIHGGHAQNWEASYDSELVQYLKVLYKSFDITEDGVDVNPRMDFYPHAMAMDPAVHPQYQRYYLRPGQSFRAADATLSNWGGGAGKSLKS